MTQESSEIPGSDGEHDLQGRHGTEKRACAFYDKQMLSYLNPTMCEFISRMEMVFIATSDSNGECDCSFRAGLPGFLHVIDQKTLLYPEYRGNGVMASLGNISENAYIGLFFADFFDSTLGLHVNGMARIVDSSELAEQFDLTPELQRDLRVEDGRKPEHWVVVEVEEAYIHCAKHIPHLKKLDKTIHWGTDVEAHKGGDGFNVGVSAGDPNPGVGSGSTN